MSRKLIVLNSILIVMLALSLVYSQIQAARAFAGWNGHVWSDTFADDTGIVTQGATQVTDQLGGDFGTSFTPYPGNPLSTLESIDPWDSGGDTWKQIPGAVHPDVQYFPEGMDGYKFWMIFTPLAFVSNPPGGHSNDYWWERPTLVRSNDGINWVKTPDYTNPLVSPGDPGAWDDGWLADPDFVYAPGKGPNGESWFLYYTGCGNGGCAIALSMSHDGKHYTKYGTGPVAPAYRTPSVIYDSAAGIFRMWYNWGAFDIGYATSPDGINWTPYESWGTIVYQGHPGTYDQGGVTHEDVVYFGGQYHMYYLALPTGAYAGLNIGHATSPDGINWTQYPTPAMVPGGESWRFWNTSTPVTVQSFYRPTVVPVGDTLYMYYGGTDSYSAYPTSHYDIGLAFPATPDGHVELSKASQPAEYTNRADTLAWYHMNEGTPPSPQYPGEYAPLDSTLAWYHFNEGDGATTIDNGGLVNDLGTISGATWTPGLYGNGLSFNNNGQVTAINSADLNPESAITIEAWVNPSVNKDNNYVAIKMTPGAADYAYGLKVNNGAIWAFIRNGGTLYWSYGGQVPLNTWSHIAMTYQVSSSPTYISLYLNGLEVSSYTTHDQIPANTLIATNTGPLNIGTIPGISNYQGMIDELRVVGRALLADEIAADGVKSAPPVNVEDSSGNNNHGTPNSGVSWTTGRFSYGLDFNGTNGAVTVPHSDTLNPQNGITIEAWVNPSLSKSNNYIINKSSPGIADYAYGLKLESSYTGSSEIGGIISAPDGKLYFAYGGSIPNGTWTHIAMTYQVGDSHIRLYKNGVEVAYRYGDINAATDPIPANTQIRTNTAPLNMGILPYGGGLYFQGSIDELRILNTALTPGEIAQDYGSSYSFSGVVTSVLVTPPAGDSWLRFDAEDNTPENTSITYSILDAEGNTLLEDVASGYDISPLGSQPIKLRAGLTTLDASKTPLLHSWSLTSEFIPNQPPTALDDSFSIDEDQSLDVAAPGVLANDSDANADPLTAVLVSGPAHGILALNSDGSFKYTPDANWSGADSFTYNANDGLADSNTAIVDLTVNAVNDPPVLTSIGNQNVDEETLLTFTATASDLDLPAQILSFSLVGTPSGASIDPITGAFTWAPTEAQGPGDFTFTVNVCDDGSPVLCDDEEITVTASEVNVTPVLDPIGNKTVEEEMLLSFTATASDHDFPAQIMIFSLADGTAGHVPDGAFITTSGILSWTPTEAQGPGTYTFDVCVSDGVADPVCETITVTVSEVNVAPMLVAIGDKIIDEETLLPFTATASDHDIPIQILTFSLVDAPAGASIDPATGAFAWTPTEEQGPAIYTFTVMVCDNGNLSLCDEEEITVTVDEVNVAPELNPIGNKAVDEETLLYFTATASDHDLPAQILTFGLAGTIPAGASISSDGFFTWTPTENQGPGTFTFNVCVNDGVADPVCETITVTVNEVNRDPILDEIGGQTVDEMTELTLTATATDPDIPANTLTFSLVGAPAGASIDPATGAFTWTPGEDQGPGSYAFTVKVCDDGVPPLCDEEEITVTVNEVNRYPVLTTIGNQTVDEMTELTLTATATDPDIPANTLTFSLVDAPEGANINPGSGAFTWTPGENQGSASYIFTVKVCDNGIQMLCDDEEITITVNEVNRAPELGAIGNKSLMWGNELSFKATATDPDLPANTLTFSLEDKPAGAAITAGGDFTWTPTSAQIGEHTFKVRVTDNGIPNLYDDEEITVTVGKRATLLVYSGDASGQYSDSVTVKATLTDNGGGSLQGNAISGMLVTFSIGSQSTTATTGTTGLAQSSVSLNQAAGTPGVNSSFAGDNLYLASNDSDPFQGNQENAYVEYTGESIARVGNSLTLRATVWDSAAAGYLGDYPESGTGASLGDITKMWVAFDIYPAGSCGSGTPTVRYAQVLDTGPLGDGIGTASTTFSSASEASFCVVSYVVAASSGETNLWYIADDAESAGIAFYNNTGQFATGGGWIPDPNGRKGNFGFNSRYNKRGSPQGQMVYIYRGYYQGVLVDFIIKSNALEALSFSGSQYPVTATLQGKCNLQINRASDGVQLWSDGNATFVALVTDSGLTSGIGSDAFRLSVWDKNGVPYKMVPSTSLSGGNVVVRNR